MQFLDDYLRQYEVPSGVRVSDGTWKKLFSEVVKRCVSIFMLDYKLVASTINVLQTTTLEFPTFNIRRLSAMSQKYCTLSRRVQTGL